MTKNNENPILILNNQEIYNKNDYINISGSEDESPQVTPISIEKVNSNFKNELGIINEESLSKDYSYYSKKNNDYFNKEEKIKEMKRS